MRLLRGRAKETIPEPTEPSSGWKPHGPLRPHDQLYFLHIPKTAGTTIRQYLASKCHISQYCIESLLPEMLTVPPARLRQFKIFAGHHGRYLNTLLEREPLVMTFLRDPMARSVSHFRDLQRREDNWLHETVREMSFEEFVCSDVGATELMNVQTRFLALEDIQADFHGHSEMRLHDLEGLMAKYSDPDLAVRAKTFLDRCAFVGVQERFDDGLFLLAATFGWTPVRRAATFNDAGAAFDDSQITERARDRVRELTALDREVYAHALGLFETRLACVSDEDAEDAYRRLMADVPRVTTVDLAFGNPIRGENWLGAGESFDGRGRWCGPETSTTLDLPLGTERRLRLRFLIQAPTRELLDSVRLTVNGVPRDLVWWDVDESQGMRAFHTPLTKDVLRENDAYCRLTFEVDGEAARSARAAHGDEDLVSPDARHRVMFFHWLSVCPGRGS